MTETDISKSQVEIMIRQIESMLIDVSWHNNVPAADMRDGLLDLLNIANALEDE